MPLGASVTESAPGHAGYRYWLWNDLAQTGYSADFVGSLTGNAGAPLYNNFDQNHEGHSGYRADQVAANVTAWAAANKPDIVLLHVGTNDIFAAQTNTSTISDIGTIIDNLRAVNPNVTVLLAQIIPQVNNVATVQDLDSLMPALVGEKTTPQSPIVLVDQFTGFDANTDTYDGTHPNATGEVKIANRWFSALQSILPAPTSPPPGTYLSDVAPTSQTNGWGSAEPDRSNGETAPNDGHMLTLNGAQYMRGIGVHAASDLRYSLAGGSYASFCADIGVDDEAGANGSVMFQVYIDDTLRYTSPKLTATSATVPINIAIPAGAASLRLVVTDGGDGNSFDHADWANARLVSGTPVTPPQPTTAFLSDLGYTVNSNGWGPVEKNRSNGEQATADGKTITLNGATYAKGLGVHAASEIVYNLNGNYTQFLSDIGVDDEVGNSGSVDFQVFLDDVKVFDSGKMTGASATQQINLSNLAGKQQIKLVVTDSGDGRTFDHADWAGARLLTSQGVPAAASSLKASLNSTTKAVDLAWTDLAADASGYRIQRKLGAAGSWIDIATLGANVQAWSDVGALAPGSTYSYRVIAFNAAGDAAPSNESSITTPAASASVWLSDLQWTSATNGWGAVEKDRSNGETGSSDGHTISIRGVTYAKGLGVHAASQIVYALNGASTTFSSDLGIDDETGGAGSVVFQVLVDGVLRFDSGVVRGKDPVKHVSVSLAGAAQLTLIVTNASDGSTFDHADWAGSKLEG